MAAATGADMAAVTATVAAIARMAAAIMADISAAPISAVGATLDGHRVSAAAVLLAVVRPWAPRLVR
jgi:hypothetical protein